MCGGPVSRTTSNTTDMLRFSADSCTSEIGDFSSSKPASESAEDEAVDAGAATVVDVGGVLATAVASLLWLSLDAATATAAAAEDPGTKGSEAGLSVVEEDEDGEGGERFNSEEDDEETEEEEGKAFAAASELLWKDIRKVN